MGKSYVENSLKRFLKRKVKITLGLVVTFMITGVCAFAENILKIEDGSLDKARSEKWLTGYNGNNSLPTISGNLIKIENGKINFDNKEIDVSNTSISNEVLENITTMAGLLDKNINENNNSNIKTSINEDAEGFKEGFELVSGANTQINEGILTTKQTQTDQMINKGLINTQEEYAQFKFSGTVYNYGIINGGKYAQGTGTGTAYNYGIINANNMSAQIINGGKGYNYGIICSSSSNAQEVGGEGALYNYGVLKSGTTGQLITKGTAYNYGIISNTGDNGQMVKVGEVYNYGIISNGQNHGQNIADGAKGYNYGIIANGKDYAITKAGENGEAINYGIIKNTTGNVFSGKVDNYGIVILTNGATIQSNGMGTSTINKGVVLQENNGNYTLDTTNSAADTVNLTSNGKVDTDGKTYYTQDKTAEISTNKLKENSLTAVITGNGDKTAFSYTGKDLNNKKDELILENTTATGYFVNNGTFLNIENADLALINTKVNVVSESGDYSDLIAVNLNGGNLSLIGESSIYGKIAGKGGASYVAHNNPDEKQKIDVTENVILKNDNNENYNLTGENKTEAVFSLLKANNLILDFAVKDSINTNKVTLNNAELKSIDGSSSTEKIELTLDSTEKVGNITLGQNDDKFTVTNSSHNGIIDMGAGDNDEFNVSMGAVDTTNHHKEAGNTFDYKVNGAEKIVLNGDGWHIGENAELNAGTTTKAGEKTTLHIADKGSLHVDMNNNYGAGNVTTSLDKMASGADLSLSTGTDAEVKFVVGDKFDVSQKQFDVAHSYSVAGANLGTAVIFKGTGTNGAVEEKDGKISLTVKEASEVGLSGYEGIYNAVLKGLSKDDDLRNAVNYQDESNLVSMIKTAGETASAFYTTGYAVTKDVTDTYMSVVEDFGRKAGKGEWIAYGKYVNSDTEFDGGKSSKGYDGDITGTVGMIEYGVNETTSYGVVYGQGDTEVDIQGGGKLDGDNTYFGGYVKHRTQNGIDLTGNIGITKSELDLSLATNTKTQGGVNHHIITDGNSDADALTFSIKGTKDYKVTDTIRLQPVVSGRYSFISQDEVTSSDANFKMDEQDITIFEGAFGGNIIKDFDIYNGRLSLSAGAEYVLTDVNKDDNARYHLYNEDLHFTGEEDIADNRIEGHIGIDYEHESGVGVDVKYEMIWTDKGDNSRVTAGIAYKF